jgi:hypothetical protein
MASILAARAAYDAESGEAMRLGVIAIGPNTVDELTICP